MRQEGADHITGRPPGEACRCNEPLTCDRLVCSLIHGSGSGEQGPQIGRLGFPVSHNPSYEDRSHILQLQALQACSGMYGLILSSEEVSALSVSMQLHTLLRYAGTATHPDRMESLSC